MRGSVCVCPGPQSDAGPSGPSECRSEMRGAWPAYRPYPWRAIEGRAVDCAFVREGDLIVDEGSGA
jgi:hypothetical protein